MAFSNGGQPLCSRRSLAQRTTLGELGAGWKVSVLREGRKGAIWSRVLAQPLPCTAPGNSGSTRLQEETSVPECSGHETVTRLHLCVSLTLLDSKLFELS